MKRHFIAPIILVLLLLCSCERNRAYKADIAGGTADLTFVDFSGGQTAQLNGEWFYWPGELKQPEAVREAVESGYSHYVAVPSAWKRVAPFENNNNLLTSGTIALKITLPEEERTWSLRIPNASTAIKAYVNGSEIGEVGRAVPDREDYVPRNLPQIAEFYSSGGDTYIAFHVVNFISSSTGIWDYPAIGDSSAMHGRRQRSIVIVCLISGALIFMGLYHITLFLLRPEETSYIFFALICLFQSARNLIMNEKILTHLFPFTSGGWEAALVVEHLSVHMIIPLFYLFFKRLFPQQVHTYAVRFVLAVSGFWTLFEITTPAMVFQRFLPWFEYFILVSVLYMLAAIGRAFVARVEGAGITLVGLGILLLAGINDVLYSTGVIQSIFLTSTGVFIYLFIQAFYLSMSFARLFNMVSRYSAELKILNKSFERFIPREVLKLLNKSSIVDIELGDYIEDNMTVFFLDIRDFTTLSEAMSPNDTFRFINSFLFRIGPVIRENGGFID
ncbi:MAG: adenylate/guanylate cyclase domain-containing protein, partial [Spirochaetota bacterium]